MSLDGTWQRLASLVSIGFTVGVVLYLISRERYLLFHGLVEVFSVMVAFTVFAIGWNSSRFTKTSFFVYLGVAYLFVGFIELLHTFAYSGMGIFPEYDANLPTQLWIAARYMESTSLLVILYFRNKRFSANAVFTFYFLMTSMLVASIFFGIFPVCYVEGIGLTPFKVVSEYVISIILICSIVIMFRNTEDFDVSFRKPLFASLFLAVAAEFSFTLYVDVYGIANLVGHYFKLLSFIFIYIALVRGSLIDPYHNLFRNLEKSRQEETERAEKLAEINDDLEAFTSAISHDIKTPLMVIEANAELLDGKAKDDDVKRILSDIQISSKHAVNLVNDLLRLSRISYQTLNLAPVDITQIAAKIVDELKVFDPERQVIVKIHEGMSVTCDKELVTIALHNLIHNSWKFTGNNRVSEIEIGMRRDGEIPVIFVRDNGIGFGPDEASSIFQPFKRLDKAKDFQGTGIGLTIVQRIVNAHSGIIWTESKPGEGATFFFTLEGNSSAI
jgi:signal transduction histidine kinase